MELWPLAPAIAMLCSIPAAVVLIGVLAHRPASGAWLRRHARVFAWIAAGGWGVTALRGWLSTDHSLLSLSISVVALLCMVAFAVNQPRAGAGESGC